MPKTDAWSDATGKALGKRVTDIHLAWEGVCKVLKRELGDAAFGSWVMPAALYDTEDGEVVLVTPTGIARDWIRRSAWQRIQELWAAQATAPGAPPPLRDVAAGVRT